MMMRIVARPSLPPGFSSSGSSTLVFSFINTALMIFNLGPSIKLLHHLENFRGRVCCFDTGLEATRVPLEAARENYSPKASTLEYFS